MIADKYFIMLLFCAMISHFHIIVLNIGEQPEICQANGSSRRLSADIAEKSYQSEV